MTNLFQPAVGNWKLCVKGMQTKFCWHFIAPVRIYMHVKLHFWCETVVFVCFREAQEEDPAEPEDAGGRVAPVAAGLAAVERFQRAAQQEDNRASQGQPSPPKRPFRTPSVPSLCALATRATVHLMTGKR